MFALPMSVGAKVLKALPALFGIQALHYLIPLVTIPYLLRVLGLDGWGRLALWVTFAQLAAIPLEYGFHMSATQAAARAQGDARALARLFATVTLAKLLIAAALIGPLYGLALLMPHAGDDPRLPLWSLATGFLQAQDPQWYFLGTERPNRLAACTIPARVAGLIAMILFIHDPGDAWIYFLIQILILLVIIGYGLAWTRRTTGLAPRDIGDPRPLFASGWRIFQLFLGSNVFDTLLPVVLGLVGTPATVGLFVGADKIARAAVGVLGPFRIALFPRMAALTREAPDEAARLWRWALARIGGLAVLGGIAMIVAAEPITVIILGPEAKAAVPIVRALGLFVPLSVVNGVIGVQWMIPIGLEARLRDAYVGAGLARLGLCALFSGEGAAMGAAIATIAGEVIVLVTCLAFMRRLDRSPWSARPRADGGDEER